MLRKEDNPSCELCDGSWLQFVHSGGCIFLLDVFLFPNFLELKDVDAGTDEGGNNEETASQKKRQGVTSFTSFFVKTVTKRVSSGMIQCLSYVFTKKAKHKNLVPTYLAS